MNSRKAVGGPFGSDSRYTANMVAEQGCQEQVVNVTERLVAGVERGTTGDAQRYVAQHGLGRRAADTTRRPTMNVSDCSWSQECFPSMIITNSSCDGVDYE